MVYVYPYWLKLITFFPVCCNSYILHVPCNAAFFQLAQWLSLPKYLHGKAIICIFGSQLVYHAPATPPC